MESTRNLPRESLLDCGCEENHEGRHFYVTVRDAGRTGFLLGPYETHIDALQHVEKGRKLAQGANDRAWFYSYGTSSLPVTDHIKTIFGA